MKKNIKNIEIAGKRVIARVDFNVPLRDGVIQDNNRIVAALPTIKHLLENGASVVLMSHLGRPKGKVDPRYSLKPVAKELEKLLGIPVTLSEQTVGPQALEKAKKLEKGGILLLENLRFHPEETSKDIEERRKFAKELAQLGEIFVSDAFGAAHRSHASVTTIAEFLPSATGFLMEKELFYWDKVLKSPSHPFVLLLGGAKVADKVPIIRNLIDKVDHILIGGGMSYTFLAAKGLNIGKSLLEKDLLPTCRELLDKAGDKIVLPVDVQSALMDFETMKLTTPLVESNAENMPADQEGLDIGSKTINTFGKILSSSKLTVWNGPMGVFECQETSTGTFALTDVIAQSTSQGALTIVGGGDSASAVKKAGKEKLFSHVSTGGGASLTMLQGKILPGVAAIDDL